MMCIFVVKPRYSEKSGKAQGDVGFFSLLLFENRKTKNIHRGFCNFHKFAILEKHKFGGAFFSL